MIKKICLGFFVGIIIGIPIECLSSDTSKQVTKVKKVISQTLKKNKQEEVYQQYLHFVSKRMDDSSGNKEFDDKNGLFRLSNVDRWIRNPLQSPLDGEILTRELHGHASDPKKLSSFFEPCTKLLDLDVELRNQRRNMRSPDEALSELKEKLQLANNFITEAFQKLKPHELDEVQKESERLFILEMGAIAAGKDPVFGIPKVIGNTHSLAKPEDLENQLKAKNLLTLLSRVDLGRIVQAAAPLLQLVENPQFLELISKVSPQVSGNIVIGGTSDDGYDLDNLKDVQCIIELGGNDIYQNGSTSFSRPSLLIIDLGGNDRYESEKPFAQGCGRLGVSLLYDREGDDRYQGADASQGCGFVGVGFLIDEKGNDLYAGDRRMQGSGIFGIGVLIDRDGNDQYSAKLFAQGYGGARGIGVIEDSAGDDQYKAGGKYEDSYKEPPNTYKEAWSQGCGSGFRGFCNGGIGILLDGAGDDLYEADYFSIGAYWFAAGFNRDFGGNDVRRPLTKEFSRYALGYSCHYAVGLIFDDTGNDQYSGGLGVGLGYDIGLGGLFDFQGDDSYFVSHTGQGTGLEGSWGILFDGDGNDQYHGGITSNDQGHAGKVTYHPSLNGTGNFSFLIDWGAGKDGFSCGAKPNENTFRGKEGGVGYLIDDPKMR